jgi:hypothetical protein
MVKKTQKTTPKKPLTAHGLLGALSYWGTAARMVLVGMFVILAYVINISVGSGDWRYVDGETIVMIYGLATLVILDAGYVTIARSLTLDNRIDRWLIMLAGLGVASFFVVPSFVEMGEYSTRMRLVSLIVVLLILSIRILLGLLYSKRKK